MAGFSKGRRIPLVEGGGNAPPENASAPGGRRPPGARVYYREFSQLGNSNYKRRSETVTVYGHVMIRVGNVGKNYSFPYFDFQFDFLEFLIKMF